MAVPTYVGKGTHVNTEGTSLNVPWPAHAENDIGFLAIIHCTNLEVQPPVTPNPVSVSGWTEVTEARYIYDDGCFQLFWKRAAGSSETSAAVTITTSGIKLTVGRIYTYRGCYALGTPYEATNRVAVFPTTDYTATSVPQSGTAISNERLGVLFGFLESNRVGTVDGLWSEQDDTMYQIAVNWRPTSMFMAIYTQTINLGGTTAAATLTRSGFFKYMIMENFVMLLKPTYQVHAGTLDMYADATFTCNARVITNSHKNLTLSFDASFDCTTNVIGEKIRLTLSSDMSMDLYPYVNRDERVFIKSKFITGKELSQDDFHSLIDYVNPSFTSDVLSLRNSSGLLRVDSTASVFSNLYASYVSDFTRNILSSIETRDQFSYLISRYASEDLLTYDESSVHVGVGLSANSTRFAANLSPIKIGLSKKTAYTSASSTNVIINSTGYVDFTYSTVQNTRTKYETNYAYTTGSAMEAVNAINGKSFDLVFSDVATSVSTAMVQLGTGTTWYTTYRFLGTSAVAASAAGLYIEPKSITQDSSIKKSGTVHGYNVRDNIWYIFGEAFSELDKVCLFAAVTCANTVSSVRIKAQTGNLRSGNMRVIDSDT